MSNIGIQGSGKYIHLQISNGITISHRFKNASEPYMTWEDEFVLYGGNFQSISRRVFRTKKISMSIATMSQSKSRVASLGLCPKKKRKKGNLGQIGLKQHMYI